MASAQSELSSSSPVIYQGATQMDLVRMYKMTASDVKAKMSACRPIAIRNGGAVYSHRDAAQALMKPPDDMVEKILTMHHNDLPKMLSKEFWYAKVQRLNYEERMGDLWRTSDVVALAGDSFKTLRLGLMLLSDAVEREVGLTEKQREIIDRYVSTALYEMQEKLVDGFKQRRTGTFGKSEPLEESDPAADL